MDYQDRLFRKKMAMEGERLIWYILRYFNLRILPREVKVLLWSDALEFSRGSERFPAVWWGSSARDWEFWQQEKENSGAFWGRPDAPLTTLAWTINLFLCCNKLNDVPLCVQQRPLIHSTKSSVTETRRLRPGDSIHLIVSPPQLIWERMSFIIPN